MARSLTILSDGKILASGHINFYNPDTGTMKNFYASLIRYTADGLLDTTFADNGISIIATDPDMNDISNDRVSSFIKSTFVQDNKKIISVGYEGWTTSMVEFKLIRHNEDGSLDTTFGNNGVLIHGNADVADEWLTAVLQDDGKIIAGGYSDYKFAIALYNTDGSLDMVLDQDDDGVEDTVDVCPLEDASGFDANVDGCLDSAEGLSALIASFELSNGLTNSLDAKAKIKDNDNEGAVDDYNALINVIENNFANGVLTDEQSALFIAYIQNIIAQLQ